MTTKTITLLSIGAMSLTVSQVAFVYTVVGFCLGAVVTYVTLKYLGKIT